MFSIKEGQIEYRIQIGAIKLKYGFTFIQDYRMDNLQSVISGSCELGEDAQTHHSALVQAIHWPDVCLRKSEFPPLISEPVG